MSLTEIKVRDERDGTWTLIVPGFASLPEATQSARVISAAAEMLEALVIALDRNPDVHKPGTRLTEAFNQAAAIVRRAVEIP